MPFYGKPLYGVKTITAGETLDGAHDLILCNNSSDITVSLPAASGMTGRLFQVKKIGNNTNTVTIDPDSTETLDGNTTLVLFVRYDALVFYSDGSNWQILADSRYKHVCKMRSTTTQSIAHNTVTSLTFDTTDVDVTGTMANLSTERITVKRDGLYIAYAQVTIPNLDAGEQMQARISVDGAVAKTSTEFSAAAGLRLQSICIAVLDLSAGSYLELGTYQDSGSSQDTTVNVEDNQPYLLVTEN